MAARRKTVILERWPTARNASALQSRAVDGLTLHLLLRRGVWDSALPAARFDVAENRLSRTTFDAADAAFEPVCFALVILFPPFVFVDDPFPPLSPCGLVSSTEDRGDEHHAERPDDRAEGPIIEVGLRLRSHKVEQ